MWINILAACIVMFIFSLFIGIVLVFANIYFVSKEDNKIVQIAKALPGFNCGACGYVNCNNFAKGLANKQIKNVDLCKVISKSQKEELIKVLISCKLIDK